MSNQSGEKKKEILLHKSYVLESYHLQITGFFDNTKQEVYFLVILLLQFHTCQLHLKITKCGFLLAKESKEAENIFLTQSWESGYGCAEGFRSHVVLGFSSCFAIRHCLTCVSFNFQSVCIACLLFLIFFCF